MGTWSLTPFGEALRLFSSSLGLAGFTMKNLIWFRVVLVVVWVALASAGDLSDLSSRSNNSSSPRVTYMLEKSHQLHRQKRWLTFELGSSMTVSWVS